MEFCYLLKHIKKFNYVLTEIRILKAKKRYLKRKYDFQP